MNMFIIAKFGSSICSVFRNRFTYSSAIIRSGKLSVKKIFYVEKGNFFHYLKYNFFNV